VAALHERIRADIDKGTPIVNPFGREARYYNFDRNGTCTEFEDAMGGLVQSCEAAMMALMLPGMQALAAEVDGRLVTTTHDSFLATTPSRDDAVRLGALMKMAMEREWPQMGRLAGCGLFSCKADLKLGQNWGKASDDNTGGMRNYTTSG
jgi:hypothetical protein